MKVLYVTPRYYPHVGGLEYVVKSVAERLAKRGHDVTVVAGEPNAERPREEEINGVRVIRWPTHTPGDAYHIPRRRGELARLLLKLDYDVAHIHSIHSIMPMYALSIIKEKGVRKVVTPYYHGTGHTPIRKALWIPWRIYMRRLLRYVHVIHTVSRLEARLVQKDFGLRATPIENGVEEWIAAVEWRPSNYVMYSGRIERYKNIHRLARIVKILNSNGFDVGLKVFGTGPYLDKLKSHLASLGLRYEIGGFQPSEKYIEYLSKSMLFGLLSEKESYPQSINEANAIGVPVVVAKPWGENFAERTRTLIVSLEEDDERIATKVAEFLKEAEKQNKPTVSTWDQVVDLYLKHLYT